MIRRTIGRIRHDARTVGDLGTITNMGVDPLGNGLQKDITTPKVSCWLQVARCTR